MSGGALKKKKGHQLSIHEKKTLCWQFFQFWFCPEKKCPSNYPKWKINKSQTCVTFSPIIINRVRILGERLEEKHSPLLLTDEIRLSLERLPKSRTITGKIETILSSECHVTFNYNWTDGLLLAGVHFRVGGPGSRPAPLWVPGRCLLDFQKVGPNRKIRAQ